MSTSLKAKKAVPKNKACRRALVEGLAAKTADVAKESPPEAKKVTKPKKARVAIHSAPWPQTLHIPVLQGDQRKGAEGEGV